MDRPASLILCVTGVECTGKSTLSAQLAEALDAPLVPEVARTYLAGRSSYDADDVLAIADAQVEAERQALAGRPRLVVADTDLSVIRIWWEEKYGELHPRIAAALAARSPRRYLLPRPDLPWEFDPLRESPHDRPRLHERYRQALSGDPFPFAEVDGLGPVRLERALAAVRSWLDG